MGIIENIRLKPNFVGSTGRTEEEIISAENELGISFADDYRTYLKIIGLASFDGHELTGLTKTIRLDVVSVTKEHQELIKQTASSWYVVEETNIDGIVIWQSSDGAIYQTAPGTKNKKIAESLSEYIVGDI